MKLDRRSTLKAIGGAAVVASMEGASAATDLPVSVIIYAGRVDGSQAFVQMAKDSGALLVDSSARDLGLAWREEIARHLRANPGRVEGYTLWSDLLISQGMGREIGLKQLTEQQVRGRNGKREAFRWTLR